MDLMIDGIVDGLFSVFVTSSKQNKCLSVSKNAPTVLSLSYISALGVIPIIRAPKNNAAEMVAEVKFLVSWSTNLINFPIYYFIQN